VGVAAHARPRAAAEACIRISPNRLALMVSLGLSAALAAVASLKSLRTFAGRDRACSIHPNRVATSVIVDGASQ
jgi:hypothetical protein